MKRRVPFEAAILITLPRTACQTDPSQIRAPNRLASGWNGPVASRLFAPRHRNDTILTTSKKPSISPGRDELCSNQLRTTSLSHALHASTSPKTHAPSRRYISTCPEPCHHAQVPAESRTPVGESLDLAMCNLVTLFRIVRNEDIALVQ